MRTLRMPRHLPPSTPEGRDVSVQWACPNMRRHMRGDYYDDELPKPCPDCYSVRITTERIPFDSAEPLLPHTLRSLADADDAA